MSSLNKVFHEEEKELSCLDFGGGKNESPTSEDYSFKELSYHDLEGGKIVE
jgi:hypothetical protein